MATRITSLPEKSIFVFGSNLAGNHAGGAAADAVKYFGAIQGQAVGIQGQSYAIPTLSKHLHKLKIESIAKYIKVFLVFARKNKELEFVVTPIGTGIAGFSIDKIAPLFTNVSSNVVLPEKFTVLRVVKGFKAFDKGLVCKDEKFVVGEIKTFDGEIEPCRRGYHFCENPLDVLDY